MAVQRLDLNLEKGRIRDELLSQNNKSIQTENRLDKEITNMRTTLEANKNDIIRRVAVLHLAALHALTLHMAPCDVQILCRRGRIDNRHRARHPAPSDLNALRVLHQAASHKSSARKGGACGHQCAHS